MGEGHHELENVIPSPPQTATRDGNIHARGPRGNQGESLPSNCSGGDCCPTSWPCPRSRSRGGGGGMLDSCSWTHHLFLSPLPLCCCTPRSEGRPGSRKIRVSQCLSAQAAHLEPTTRLPAHQIGDTLLSGSVAVRQKQCRVSRSSIESSSLVGDKRLLWLLRSRIKGLKQEYQVSSDSSNLSSFSKHPI
jgi:hypothetical protein